MKIGIIGPSKLREKEKIIEIATIIAKLGYEIVLTPNKDSCSEFFAQKYFDNGGEKVYSVIPLDDKEFGYDWVNTELGETINCKTWRNQPEKLNEECQAIVCLGYSTGGLIETCYSKWFNKKSVYIINELISGKLPKELEKDLDLRYISLSDLEKELQNVN